MDKALLNAGVRVSIVPSSIYVSMEGGEGYIDDDISVSLFSLEKESVCGTDEISPCSLVFQHVDLL